MPLEIASCADARAQADGRSGYFLMIELRVQRGKGLQRRDDCRDSAETAKRAQYKHNTQELSLLGHPMPSMRIWWWQAATFSPKRLNASASGATCVELVMLLHAETQGTS